MRPLRFPAALLLGACIACFDFGYDVPPYQGPPLGEQTGTSSAAGDGGSADDCVEGEATPSTEGPQVKFITLNVDVPTLKIKSGDVVTWTNSDSMAHSVNAGAPGAELTSTPGGFSSPDLPANGKWAYRFCRKRVVFYFCGKHPQQMNGYRITVE
jgi:plastocyanin